MMDNVNKTDKAGQSEQPKASQIDFQSSQIYTRKEVAEKLGISEMTLSRAEKRGVLRSYKAGSRKVRYTGRMVKAWLERDLDEEE